MYMRSKSNPEGAAIPLGHMRMLLGLILIGYPLGCLLRLLAGEGPFDVAATKLVGTLLIGLAFLAFLWIGRSSLQRMMQEEPGKLDERELFIRRKAHEKAYTAFSALTLVGLIYLELAIDAAPRHPDWPIWTPASSDHWEAIIWGALLYAMTLPAAFEAFSRKDDDED